MRVSFGVILIVGIQLGACSGAVQGPATAHPMVERDIERLRVATRPFLSLDSAVTAGYAREVADCLVHEHHGAMGYHHVNRNNLDAQADVERPEILLYERRADGQYRLN